MYSSNEWLVLSGKEDLMIDWRRPEQAVRALLVDIGGNKLAHIAGTALRSFGPTFFGNLNFAHPRDDAHPGNSCGNKQKGGSIVHLGQLAVTIQAVWRQ